MQHVDEHAGLTTQEVETRRIWLLVTKANSPPVLKRTPIASDHSKLLLEFSREFARTEGWVLNRFEIVDDRRDVVRIEREDWHIGMAGNDALGQ
jgi:hypothetical protein